MSGPFLTDGCNASAWLTTSLAASADTSMTDTDLQLIDDNPRDPFDFSQERYNDQLVAGYSKNTAALGLQVYMPDYHRVAKPRG